MTYARINLHQTDYSTIGNAKRNPKPNISQLNKIYTVYCRYKKFKSVMPMFDSEYTSEDTDVIEYYHEDKLVAFSLLRIYDQDNVEAIQFAWDYANPELHLGIKSLRHECALYKKLGFKYLYLGGADEYKKQIDGFEILGPA